MTFTEFRLEIILPRVCHANYIHQRDLCRAFIRIIESQDNPYFRDSHFTLEEFERWYIQNSGSGRKNGRCTYYTDWHEFSINSDDLTPFREGRFNPLSLHEKRLLEAIARETKEKRFHVIGTYGENPRVTINHEISHILFEKIPTIKPKLLK